MRPDSKMYLFDIQGAASLVLSFTRGKELQDYEGDVLLRSAVERQLEIAGEALAQLSRRDPELAAMIENYRQIIAFRNVLVHGYAQVEGRRVWEIIEGNLPALIAEVKTLLETSP